MTYIWDLDGTLIDSYPMIMKSLMDVLDYFKIKLEKEYVYNFIMQKSVHEFLEELSNTYSIDLDILRIKHRDFEIKTERNVVLMDYAKETLEGIINRKDINFIYTHKGPISKEILKDLGIYSYFKDVITSEDGFKKKPDPEGINYILKKYNINKEEVYYVGDRPLDVLCAKNANVKSILYKKEGSPIEIDATLVINNLIQILK